MSAIPRLKWPLQFLVVFVVVAGLTLLTDAANYRAPVNLVWLLGMPVLTAILSNDDAGSRTLMGIFLIICSWLTTGLLAVIFGIGP